MALVTCPDCNGSVSDVAPACPHCGRPNTAAAAPVVQVQATQGATGKFLDPGANARSCLGCVAVVVIVAVGIVILMMMGVAFK
jgi:hypothetical protein